MKTSNKEIKDYTNLLVFLKNKPLELDKNPKEQTNNVCITFSKIKQTIDQEIAEVARILSAVMFK